MTDPAAPSSPDPTQVGPASWPRRTRRAWASGWVVFRGLPRSLRVSTYVVVGLVLVLLAGLVTATVVVRRPFPQTTGEASLPGLEGEVEVVRDDHGVPQLYGDSVEDLVRAQGYVQAQERFYEMDVRRHATAGRLAELFGEAALESDLVVRTMGWRRVAEEELGLLEPETRAALEAYSEGVNAYLDQHDPSEIAIEYTLLDLSGLDYRPADWTPVDSLAWLKAMAWDLRGNMSDEIDRVLTAADVGPERAAELWPPYPYDEHAPIVDQGAVVDDVFEQDAERGGSRNPVRPPWRADQVAALRAVGRGLEDLPAWLGRGDGVGSNSWVVDGEHSTTGAPILANDPHLGVGLPGVWMQMGLHCRTVSPACALDVAGFTFSGVPGVVIGHNADIAWGFTNLGPDVTDLYLERVDGDSWIQDGERRPLRTRTETVEVRDGDDVRLEVRATAHGPILSDVSEAIGRVADAEAADPPGGAVREGEELAVSLQWTALRPAPTADAILQLNLATDWDSFRAAASSFAVPAQNLVYADREGHIGYQAPGRIPIRKSGNDGRLPAAGWRSENDWTGDYLPFSSLPHVLDPEDGFVVTANQAVVAQDFPSFFTDDWDRGYRSQRIRDVLEDRFADGGTVSVGDMTDLQLDTASALGPVLTPYLLQQRMPGGYYTGGQRQLRDWDFTQPAEGPQSAAAAYFNVVWRTVLQQTFDDELSPEVRPDGGQRWWAVMERLLREPRDPWWDDVTTEDVVETRDDVLRQSMLDARDELTRLDAHDADDWEWGHLHRLELREQTLGDSGIAPVEWLVNRGGWKAGGGGSAVDATAWDAAEGYTVTAAPSMRMVVSLAELDDSRWINLTGVSGHPFHPHYTDQTDLWARGETLAWAFSPDAVRAAADDTMTLAPAQE
ncbi:penicillin acylase family protein [Nocardioides sp. Leaf307]|uniref:penicillin acylase family protein n=1 Tax=Nocardioides sp. Leaf307 TaxID=1736331 RepID=UPI0009E92479|nr:penicillin acylase family protein [Nocardioides sp. Leaf307]